VNAQNRNAQRRKALLAKPTRTVVSSGAPRALRSAAVSPMLQTGALVKAHDRDNFGYVLQVRANSVEVTFRNPETGATATKDFHPVDLTVVR
jgi:hypothetical protein